MQAIVLICMEDGIGQECRTLEEKLLWNGQESESSKEQLCLKRHGFSRQ